MRQGNPANLRALVAAVLVVSFVVVSSYITFGNSSSKIPNQNQGSGAPHAVASQNTTTYSYATETSQATSTFSTQMQTPTMTEIAPSVQHFGNQHFEPPSGILIPANTLVWTNFRLNETTTEYIAATILYFPFPSAMGANITVAIYVNGILNVSSTTPVFNHDYGISPSLIPSSTSANSVFALTGLTTDIGMGTQTGSPVNLNGATITVAVMTNKPVWLAGWTQTDMLGGSGGQFGSSLGQLSGTYETPGSMTLIPPTSLPQATSTLSFELQISGALSTQ